MKLLAVFVFLLQSVYAEELQALPGSDNSTVPPKSHAVSPSGQEQLLKLAKRVDESFTRCFEVGQAICLGQEVLTSGARQNGLVAHWSFDHIYPIDESGNGNHIIGPVVSGPSSSGHGSSAAFDESAGCRVLSSASLEFQEFTLNLRLYLLGEYDSSFRAIVSRSNYSAQGPTVLLHPTNNKLSVRVSTTESPLEGFTSNANIPLRRWTQVTVVASKGALKLYINGMLDSLIALRGELVQNSGDLFIGKSFDLPGFEGYLDDLKLYNYAMGERLVPAFVSSGLTGFDASFRVQLASTGCTLKEAMSSGLCSRGCKLCTLDQLYRNAAHVARVNGWMHRSNQIWHKGIYNTAPNEKRVALCCC